MFYMLTPTVMSVLVTACFARDSDEIFYMQILLHIFHVTFSLVFFYYTSQLYILRANLAVCYSYDSDFMLYL